jgi:hypothetical protein
MAVLKSHNKVPQNVDLPMQERRLASPVCTKNLIRVDDVMESPKLAE